jgi:hypothetical protein
VSETSSITRRDLHPLRRRSLPLVAAGIVAKGTTKGQRMHKARAHDWQRVLDTTGI